jgi:hypothetical protein
MNKYNDILDPIAELLLKKNTDYGNSYNILREEFGKTAFIIRISDKLNRLKSLQRNTALVTDESEDDTIRDIIGYCALELMYREEDAEDE